MTQTVCDECIIAVQDESPSLSFEEAQHIAKTMGEMIPDHICEARENDENCECSCNMVEW